MSRTHLSKNSLAKGHNFEAKTDSEEGGVLSVRATDKIPLFDRNFALGAAKLFLYFHRLRGFYSDGF